MQHILVTGGAGFIGSHLVRHLVQQYPHYHIYNLDALTYAGNLQNLQDIQQAPNYTFIHADVRNLNLLTHLFQQHPIDTIIHLAAESHVDRSIHHPLQAIEVNTIGTATLLHVAQQAWTSTQGKLFYQVSTDEVYGALGPQGLFTENTPYTPHSPYSASKASADHLVRAFSTTYGIPYIISNCSNNYGPYQFPEKLIPLTINNILHQQPIPIYGTGQNIRDWLYVLDHVQAIDTLLHHGKQNQTYLIGGHNEQTNLQLVQQLCTLLDNKLNRPTGTSQQLITFVSDRQGHDFRYAIDPSKIQEHTNWQPTTTLQQGLTLTVDWYLSNPQWLANVTSGAYRTYYQQMYTNRKPLA